MTDTAFTLSQEQQDRERARNEQVVATMQAQGVQTDIPVQADYFGFDETHRVMLPDGISWIDHQTFTEGSRRKYMNAMNREVKVQKVTGDAIMKMASGDERYNLLLAAIKGWNLQIQGRPMVFNDSNLKKFLDAADPKVIDVIEKDVRKANPWLVAEVTVEEIDKQIVTLQELRASKLTADEGEDS